MRKELGLLALRRLSARRSPACQVTARVSMRRPSSSRR